VNTKITKIKNNYLCLSLCPPMRICLWHDSWCFLRVRRRTNLRWGGWSSCL